MADFLLASKLTGGSKLLTAAIMGSGVAADTVIDAKDRGLSDDQAFLLGSITGAIEIAVEYIPFEEVLKKLPQGRDAVANAIRLAGQVEAAKTLTSDFRYFIADLLISKDKSEWMQTVDYYIADGYSETDAWMKALEDTVFTMLIDSLTSYFAGGAVEGARRYGSGSVAMVEDEYGTYDYGTYTNPDASTSSPYGLAQERYLPQSIPAIRLPDSTKHPNG